MPHFVRNGEHAVEGILLVQKNIGMRIAAGRVCAAALALVFVYIDPAVVEAFGQNLDIILSEGLQSFDDDFLCFFVRNLLIGIADDRGVEIVHMKLFRTGELFAQSNVFVEILKVCVHCIDKVAVNGNGNFRFGKCCFKRAVVPACLCIEDELLYLPVEERRGSVLKAFECAVQGFECSLADVSVGIFKQGNIRTLCNFQLVAVGIVNAWETDVRIAERRCDFFGCICHFSCGSKQLFFGIGKNMVFLAADFCKFTLIESKLGLFVHESSELLIGNCKNFGSVET